MSTLICYDGSDSAKRALAVAHNVLGDGRAVLLHVWNPPEAVLADSFSTRSAGPGHTPGQDKLEEMARQRAAEVIDQGRALAAQLGMGVETRDARSHASVWQTIIDIADELDAELIVAGTHGTTAVSDEALGSVSGGLVHHSGRPVLIVPSAHRG
ncbi:MAG: universal stress protein [Solirubrobacteraceae bacterium]